MSNFPVWLQANYCRTMFTMVFTMRYWKNLISVFCALLPFSLAYARGIEAQSGELLRENNFYTINALFSIDLNPKLKDALQQGIPLQFVAEFDITGPRWYSWYHAVASGFLSHNEQRMRLSYHAISRQYRVTRGSLYHAFSKLEEALGDISRVKAWRVLEVDQFNTEAELEGRIRLSLDTAELPKPFQINLIGDQDWNLVSDWLTLTARGVQ